MPWRLGWLLNALYVMLLTAIAPLLIFRRVTRGKYRRGWPEKLWGRIHRQHPARPCIWFHAVSVGEVMQLQPVLEQTQQQFPSAEFVITVTTETGYDVAVGKYPQHTVTFFPLDFTWAVERALSAIRPDLIVLVELELWPNFIFAAKRRQIPVALINGRITEKSLRGYQRIRFLMRRLLQQVDLLACQSEMYADRLKSLGAPAERVLVTGNIKFDRIVADRENERTRQLRDAFYLQKSDRVLIAGSTQDPEERIAISAWQQLRAEFPQLRLILVPRHKERFEEVAQLIQDLGCPLVRRSQLGTAAPLAQLPSRVAHDAVLLLDTLGELAACWGLADVAFVGGSLTQRGGQNMIEPAGYGAAVLFGPNTWNFQETTDALLSRQAACVVHDADEFVSTLRRLLSHPEQARQMGDAARQFVASQQGATQRTVQRIAQLLEPRLKASSPESEEVLILPFTTSPTGRSTTNRRSVG